MNKRKYLLGISIIVLALAFLIFRGLDSSMMAYLDVSDIADSPEVNPASVVQVTGIVQPGSLQSDPATRQVNFLLRDMKSPQTTIPVVYTGILPDNFKPGQQVVVQGKVNQEKDRIEAHQLLAKCPSKYNTGSGE